jgi:hypothetical protein
MESETQSNIIHVNKFIPRAYQLPICNALESEGGKYRKIFCLMPRRSGKDLLAWILMIRAAIRSVGTYIYCLPYYQDARGVIWDAMTSNGDRFLDYIPRELTSRINQQQMQVHLINGSIIKLSGSNAYDSALRGRNAKMIVFSEFAFADPDAYTLGALPIIRESGGSIIILSTPSGKNHFYDFYTMAKNSPKEWFTYVQTVDDTQHISIDSINADIARGEISAEKAAQEYWCSFEGQEGAYYSKYINKMHLENRIGTVLWDPYHKVYTAWDLGIQDPTAIIFFQVIGPRVLIIDYYENNNEGMEHFAKVIQSKEYRYAGHFPPHDIEARESARGLTKRALYAELGIEFEEPVRTGVLDGIEFVRRTFSKLWIDKDKCSHLIKALDNYRARTSIKAHTSEKPLHDRWSHACDAMRYMACALPMIAIQGSPEELDKRYKESMYGTKSNLPSIFQDNNQSGWY